MRPDRFHTLLTGLLKDDPQVQAVQTLEEAGLKRHAYGHVVTYATGATVMLQIIAMAAPGDRYSEPEKIIEGDSALAEVEVPDAFEGGKLHLAKADQRLAALVTNSGSREVASVEAFSTREAKTSVPYGVRVNFHDESTILVYVVHAAAAGRDVETGREFDVPVAV